MLEGFWRKNGLPKNASFLERFYVDFGWHFGGQKRSKNNIKMDPKSDHFLGFSRKGPGAVFGGFWAPKWEGFGRQNGCQNGIGSKKGVLQF